jgi:Cytochrome P450
MDDAPHRIIYRELLNPEANKGRPIPTALHLQHEAEVLFSAGSHTVGTTLMTGVYHLLRSPEAKQRLVDELRAAWPSLDQAPNHEELEKLPFLASSFFESRLGHIMSFGTDCCDQGDAAPCHVYSCWSATCVAAVWRGDLRCSDSRRGRCSTNFSGFGSYLIRVVLNRRL